MKKRSPLYPVKHTVVWGTLFVLQCVAHAQPVEDPILDSLSFAVQKEIKEWRNNCVRGSPTSGDDGLMTFNLPQGQAVLVDTLNLCVDEYHRGVNYATGFSHEVFIYVRLGPRGDAGEVWRKAFSKGVTDDVWVSTDLDTTNFRAMVISVHGGDKDCPFRDKKFKRQGDAWKHEKCDFVVKWDGTKFIWKPL